MKKENRVLVAGSVAQDTIETPFGRRENALGGSAVFFSWACSFFSKVEMVGVVGRDFLSENIELLKKRGIDLRGLKQVEGKTFHWEGRYDCDFNTAHTINTELNVFADFTPVLEEDQKEIEYVFLANIDPEIQLEVAQQMNSAKVIAADTMNFWIENKKEKLMEVLGVIDFLFVNDAEARQLGNDPNLMRACRKILDCGPSVLVVKQGEYGATMFYSTDQGKVEIFSAPSIPLDSVVDPTGAGDSFAGAFIGSLAKSGEITGASMRNAVAMGSVVASFTVEGFSLDALRNCGAEDIDSRYRQLRRIAFFEEINR